MYGSDSAVGRNDKRLMEWLVNLHSTMNKDRIDVREIDNLVKLLQHFTEDAKDSYVNSLLYPESALNAKLPTLFPIPSTAFQMHFTYLANPTYTAPNNGNFAWTWNPFFLQDAGAGAPLSTFFFDSSSALTGAIAGDAAFFAIPLGYNQIPAGIYGSFRVVSASIVVSYVGKMDSVSGVLGVGVGLNNQGIASPGVIAANDIPSNIFSNFAQVDNLYFHERTQAANGLRAIYFPIDDKYTYFLPLNTGASGPGSTLTNCYNTGFYFAGYAQGLPLNGGAVRFDFYVNYECLVQPQFNNFIPSTPSQAGNVDVIKTAGDLINASPELVVKPGSEIPGKPSMNVGTGGFLAKLVGNGEPVMDMNIKDMYRLVNKWY